MTYHSNLSQLRFGLKRLYELQEREHIHRTPGLHHLLPIPLPERLVLLAVIDGATEGQMWRALKCRKDDGALKSGRMKRAMKRLKGYLASPVGYWPEVWTRTDLTPGGDLTNGLIHEESQGVAWNRRYGASLETHLGRLLWSDVAVCLVGQSVPRRIGRLSLKQRMILYCLLVEETTQEETMRIMGCTAWDIDRSLRDGLRAVRGV